MSYFDKRIVLKWDDLFLFTLKVKVMKGYFECD